MGIELHVRLGDVLLDTFIVIEDPHLDLTIVGTSREQPVLEGRPLKIVDGTIVTSDQRSGGGESLRLFSIEDSDSGGGFPVCRNHLAVRGKAIVLV